MTDPGPVPWPTPPRWEWAKLGFTEVERFEEFDAEQWLGPWTP